MGGDRNIFTKNKYACYRYVSFIKLIGIGHANKNTMIKKERKKVI